MGSAEGLHLVERFTRVASDTIDYEITHQRSVDVDEAVDRGGSPQAARRADFLTCLLANYDVMRECCSGRSRNARSFSDQDVH